jgi:hypothetical protein
LFATIGGIKTSFYAYGWEEETRLLKTGEHYQRLVRKENPLDFLEVYELSPCIEGRVQLKLLPDILNGKESGTSIPNRKIQTNRSEKLARKLKEI